MEEDANSSGTSSNHFQLPSGDDAMSNAEKFAMLQQMFQKKQEELLASFESAQQSLMLQGLRDYFAAQQDRMDTSSGSTTSLTGAGPSSSLPQTPTTSNAGSSSVSQTSSIGGGVSSAGIGTPAAGGFGAGFGGGAAVASHATPPSHRHRRGFHQSLPSQSLLRAPQPVDEQWRLCSDMRSLSGSSQTISQHTRDRLKTMIASRRAGSGAGPADLNIEQPQAGAPSGTPPSHQNSPQIAAPSPHFEPYPMPANHASLAQPGEYALRKVNSEPNMKMKIRARLLSKGSSPVHSANSAFNFHQPNLQRCDSEMNTNHTAAPSLSSATPPALVLPPSLMMPSPSLPNLLPNAGFDHLQLASLMAQASNLSSFLSLPSLLKNQLAMNNTSMLEEKLQERDRLDPRSAGSTGHLPVGGYQSLLKQQLRELVLRRKSLVREEPEDDDSHGGFNSLLNPAQQSSLLLQAGGGLGGGHSSSSSSACGLDHLTAGSIASGTGSAEGSQLQLTGEQGCSSASSSAGRTGLAYDATMARHECVCGDSRAHVEHGGRVQSIWARLAEKGLVARCERVASRKASLDMLKTVHPPTYVTFFAVSPTACLKVDTSLLPLKSFVQLNCGGIGIDSDTYFNDACTQSAARVAVGSLVELACCVAEGRLRNGFACIRPPGHHAEREQAMGFCFFNNVAITARVLQQRYPRECARIAIIDWDVHHGNGTQPVFEEDPSVLYLSMHRHDNGNFFPGTGAVTEVGKGAGKGHTVNVAFSGGVMRDADYLAAWRVVVIPILDHFRPDFILVSAGFDACKGHANALGGYEVSPQMFGFMTRQLMSYAGGKVVLALEGGYDLTSIADAAEECVRVLSSQSTDEAGQLSAEALEGIPCIAAQETIQKVIAIHKGYWPTLTALQGINTSEQQWQLVNRQFENMTVTGRMS